MIAFSGKGGSGKTTLSSLVLKEIVAAGRGPVLAVDADPNATLASALGAETGGTIADLREDMGEAAQKPSEISKDRLMDQWLAELLVEEKGFDLLTMGRPEGPKCYCYVNGLLRRYLKLLRENYPFVVVDCEAGMEYLSRLTVDDVDSLVLVAEDTPVGLRTAHHIANLARSLPIRLGKLILAINKVGLAEPSALAEWPKAELPAAGAMVKVPFDAKLAERSARGDPMDPPAGSAAGSAIQELAAYCMGQESAQVDAQAS
jgi:CO dehydrogenase maturation factor